MTTSLRGLWPLTVVRRGRLVARTAEGIRGPSEVASHPGKPRCEGRPGARSLVADRPIALIYSCPGRLATINSHGITEQDSGATLWNLSGRDQNPAPGDGLTCLAARRWRHELTQTYYQSHTTATGEGDHLNKTVLRTCEKPQSA